MADGQAAVDDGRADVEHFAVAAGEFQAQAVLAEGGDGRDVGYVESVAVFLRFAGDEGDIGAGDEGVEAGDAAAVDARFDHPKLGVAFHHVFYVGVKLRGQLHTFAAFAQADVGDFADVDAEHAHDGVVDFDAFGAVEVEGDFRAGVADVVEQQPAAHEKCG